MVENANIGPGNGIGGVEQPPGIIVSGDTGNAGINAPANTRRGERTLDPAAADAAAGGNAGTRKSGWPKGKPRGTGAQKPAKEPEKLVLGEVAGAGDISLTLSISHAVLAAMFGPELNLSAEDNIKMTESLMRLNEHYKVKTNPKMLAWWAFAGTAYAVYTPRFAAISERKRMQKSAKGQVQTMTQTMPEPQKTPIPDVSALFGFGANEPAN